MSDDTLSEVLRGVRLTGAIFFSVDASAPWVAEVPPAEVLAPHVMPGVERVIEYHVVTAGSCWGGPVNQPALRLEKGDIIVFPQGDPHVISSAPGMRGPANLDAYRTSLTTRLPLAISNQGGGPERANLICGFLGCDSRIFNPLLSALPRVIHVRHNPGSESVIRGLVDIVLAESGRPRSGGECVVARLSELLFIEVVRHYIDSLPSENLGWFAGLRDDHVGRALNELHGRPAHPWTLEDLARQVGMSRSMFAERFVQFVGVPPMQYLTQWRMQLAASLLSGSTASLAEIAERVGYGSEAALSRAFKRSVGTPPAVYRQSKRGGGSDAAS